jgi:hypothetical protein
MGMAVVLEEAREVKARESVFLAITRLIGHTTIPPENSSL